MFESITLTPSEFAAVAKLARQEFGLELGPGKEQLVASRLAKKMRALNLSTFREYHQHVLGDRSGQSLIALIDALTTNHTNFFREPAHFDFLRERLLPEWQARGPMRIWCAASSTGEEPYSIAMTAREHAAAKASLPTNLPTILATILATDICTEVLATAQKAMYRADRFQGEPAPWIKKAPAAWRRAKRGLVSHAAGDPGHGGLPAPQSDRAVAESGSLRGDLLPQRHDLL